MPLSRRASIASAFALVASAAACSSEPFLQLPHPSHLASTSPTAPDAGPETSDPTVTSAAAAAPAETVVFGHEDPRTGTADETYGIDLVIRGARYGESRTTDFVYEQRERRAVEVLAARPVPKLRLAFTDARVTKIHDGEQTVEATPLSGKMYRVALLPDTAIITDDAGGHVPRSEGELLARRYAHAESQIAAHQRFTSRPARVGDRSDPLEGMLRAEFGAGLDAVKFGAVEARLVAVRDVGGARCAVFRARVEVTIRGPLGLTFTNALVGDIAVRTRDGLIARMELAGPATMSGSVDALEVTGEGHAVLRSTYTYD